MNGGAIVAGLIAFAVLTWASLIAYPPPPPHLSLAPARPAVVHTIHRIERSVHAAQQW